MEFEEIDLADIFASAQNLRRCIYELCARVVYGRVNQAAT